MMNNNIISQSLTIAFTRITFLLTPFIYVLMISNFAEENLESFVLSNQYTQIVMILLVSFNIGSNIIFVQTPIKKIFSYCSVGLFVLSVFFSVICYFFSLPLFDETTHKINFYYLLSMPVSALYLVGTSYLEANQQTKIPFTVAVSALIFTLLCIGLSFFFEWNDLNFVIALMWLNKLFILFLTLWFIQRKCHQRLYIAWDMKVFKEMWTYGYSEAFVSLLFTGSIFLAVYILHYLFKQDISIVGLSLSYKNIFSMFFIAFAIAYSINYADIATLKISQNVQKVAVKYFLLITLLLIATLPVIAYLYLSNNPTLVMSYFIWSIFIIAFDGIGVFFVRHLRINGLKRLPPLFRLSFVVIGFPLGLMFAYLGGESYFYLPGLLFGNLIFACLFIAIIDIV